MLILLPPSEGKAAPRRGAALDLDSLTAAPLLSEPRAEVLDALVELCSGDPADAAKVLGIGHTQHDLVELNAGLRTAPTARADRIYTGVLYDALDLASLDASARRRATRWVAVQSALFGLVRPQDRIPAYRLSGDTTLPGLGKVSTWWRPRLQDAMAEAAGTGLVIDLRSGAYAAFWKPPAELASRVATVRVLHEVDGKRQVVSHFNKATKGRLVRALLEDGGTPSSPARLADHLGSLGWKVELGDPAKAGTQLDVVVAEL